MIELIIYFGIILFALAGVSLFILAWAAHIGATSNEPHVDDHVLPFIMGLLCAATSIGLILVSQPLI